MDLIRTLIADSINSLFQGGFTTFLILFGALLVMLFQYGSILMNIFQGAIRHATPARRRALAKRGYGTEAPQNAGAAAVPEYSLNQVVYRPTWGVKLLTFCCAIGLAYFAIFSPEHRFIEPDETLQNLAIRGAISFALLWITLNVFIYEARIDQDTLHARHWTLQMREYDLRNLILLRKSGNATWKLSFDDGTSVEILNHVKGAADLHEKLMSRLKVNNAG